MSADIDLERYYKKNRRHLVSTTKLTDDNAGLKEKIDNNVEDLNNNISQLKMIKDLEENLTHAYKKYRKEPMNIEIKSELTIRGPLNELIPYIKWDSDEEQHQLFTAYDSKVSQSTPIKLAPPLTLELSEVGLFICLITKVPI